MGGPESFAWRVMLGLPAVPAAVFYLLVLGVPESPRWLVKQGRREEGEAVVWRVGCEPARQIADEVAESLRRETVAADEPFFTRNYRKPILLALMVATFNQLSGIDASSTTPPTSSRWPAPGAPARCGSRWSSASPTWSSRCSGWR